MRTPSGQEPAPRYLTVAQAAEFANVGERFIRRLISDRRLPFHHLGRKVRICEADLVRFIDAGRVDAAHPDSLHIFRNGR